VRSLDNLGERTLHLSIELEGRVRAALEVPVEGRIVFGGGGVVQDGGQVGVWH